LNKNNYILIKGGSYEKVKKALKGWFQMYSKDLDAKATFHLFNDGKGQYIIQADEGLDNDRFYYLVNYMKYPIDIEYEIDIIGYVVGNQDNIFKNRELQVYISENDKDGDNVYVTTQENENYKIDFGGKIILIQNNIEFEKKPIPKLVTSEVLKNSTNKKKRNEDTKTNANTNKRFKLISLAIGISYILLLALLYLNWETSFFVKSIWYLNLGVALWLFIDYELLRDNVKYLWVMIIALSIIPYTLLVIDEFGKHSFHTSLSSSLHAIVLLIIQWPLRRLFLKIFKVEPEVDRTGNIQNVIYTFILAMGMMIIPFIIEDLVNK
jgi:hypothetical protein